MSQEAFQRYLFFCLMVLTSLAIAISLIYTKAVLFPFILAVFFYLASTPPVNFLERKNMPRFIAVTITSGVVLLFAAAIFLQILLSLRQFMGQLDTYQRSIINLVNKINEMAARFNLQLDSSSLKEIMQSLPLGKIAQQLTGDILSFLATTFLVLVIYFFLMLGRARTASNDDSLYQEIEKKISSYIIYKSLISITTGVLVGIILMSFSVELAFMFAVVTALLNLIPSLGSILATALPMPVVLLQYGFGMRFALVLISITIIQIIIGNFIEPKIIGKDLDLHPIVMLLSLIFWGLIWGLGGTFLAVPLTATIKLILSRLKETKRLSEIFAGRI